MQTKSNEMGKFTGSITTLSPFINSGCIQRNIIVVFDNFVYIINHIKLFKVLSLLKKMSEFNTDFDNNSNITNMMSRLHLNNKELLNELSFYRIKNSFIKSGDELKGLFCNNFISDQKYTKTNLQQLLKRNIKNMFVFGYFQKHNENINSYIERIIYFFHINPHYFKKKFYSPNIFLRYLFETYKIKANRELNFPDNFISDTNCQFSDSEIFGIEKILTKDKNCFFFSIKNGIKFRFKVNFANIYYLREYIQLSKHINNIRLKRDLDLLQKSDILNKFDSTVIQKEITQYKNNSNLSLLNQNQIFYLCINEQNRKNLDELFGINIEQKLFGYFADNDSPFLNYANLQIL